MTHRKLRFSVVLLGLALVAGVIPAAQAGRSARVGASSAVTANQAEGDGTVEYSLNLSAGDLQRDCHRRRGRRICVTSVDFTARIPTQNDPGESPDQDECRYDRRVKLFEKTRRGRDQVAAATTDNNGTADFGTIQGVSAGEDYIAVAQSSTFSDRYGDLITCAQATSNQVTL